MVDDAVNVAIAKALPLTFYMIPLRFLEKLLLCSYPAQKVVAISAIVCHKTGSLLRLVATLFDDESGAKASEFFLKNIFLNVHVVADCKIVVIYYPEGLTAYTKVLDNFRDGWLHMSRSPVPKFINSFISNASFIVDLERTTLMITYGMHYNFLKGEYEFRLRSSKMAVRFDWLAVEQAAETFQATRIAE